MIVSALDKNLKELNDFVMSLAESELNLSKGGWTVFEILDHLLITEKSVQRLISGHGSGVSQHLENFGNDRLNKILFEGRERKVAAPEFLSPKNAFKNKETFLEQFNQVRKALHLLIEKEGILSKNTTFKHPMLGEMTASDWMYFLIHHLRRHIEQIKKIISAQSE